jgi:hypothetical protein
MYYFNIPSSSPLGSRGGSPITSNILRDNMDLSVASVYINGVRHKVLFDYEDTSGDRVNELYNNDANRPVKVIILLSNREVYGGVY